MRERENERRERELYICVCKKRCPGVSTATLHGHVWGRADHKNASRELVGTLLALHGLLHAHAWGRAEAKNSS